MVLFNSYWLLIIKIRAVELPHIQQSYAGFNNIGIWAESQTL